MGLIERHLARSILSMTLIVGLGLLAIYSFTSFVGEVSSIGKGDYGLWKLLQYTLLNLPYGLQTLLPIIGMLGTLLGLGQLAAQGEITAMRTAGVSGLRFGAAACLAGALLGVVGWILGDWVAPYGRHAAERLKTEARYGVDAGAALKPVWLREGAHFIHIQRVISERHIEGITVYTVDDSPQMTSALAADDAQFDDGRWHLRNVQRTRFTDGRTESIQVDEAEFADGLSPDVLRLFVLEARSLSTRGLVQLIHYLDSNGLDVSRQRLSLWRKLVAPLTVVAMMLFAIPFVLTAPRTGGAGLRLLIGVLIGVGFYVVNEVSAGFGQLYSWHPALSAGAPTMLLTLAALALIYRGR